MAKRLDRIAVRRDGLDQLHRGGQRKDQNFAGISPDGKMRHATARKRRGAIERRMMAVQDLAAFAIVQFTQMSARKQPPGGRNHKIAQTAKIGPCHALGQHHTGIANGNQRPIALGHGIERRARRNAGAIPCLACRIKQRIGAAERADRNAPIGQNRRRARPDGGGHGVHRHQPRRAMAHVPHAERTVIAERDQPRTVARQHQFLDPRAVRRGKFGNRSGARQDRDTATIIACDNCSVGRNGNAIGAHADLDHAAANAGRGVPFAQSAVDTGGDKPRAIEPGQRQDIAGMPGHGMDQPPVARIDAHDAIERACRDQPVVGGKARHVDIIAMPRQHDRQPQIGQ